MVNLRFFHNEQEAKEYQKDNPEFDFIDDSGDPYSGFTKLGTQPYPHYEHKTPVTLIKVGERQFMERLFQEGEIYMQTLEHYRNIELKDKGLSDGRGDEYEGIDAINQVNQVSLGDKSYDVKFQLRINFPRGCKGIVYSMFGVFDKSWMNGTFVLPESMKKMGDCMVVVTDPMVFLDRCASAINKAGGQLQFHSVSYYNEEEGDYFLNPWLKRKQFSTQSEYRLFVPCMNKKPLILHIGSLADIAELVHLEHNEIAQ